LSGANGTNQAKGCIRGRNPVPKKLLGWTSTKVKYQTDFGSIGLTFEFFCQEHDELYSPAQVAESHLADSKHAAVGVPQKFWKSQLTARSTRD